MELTATSWTRDARARELIGGRAIIATKKSVGKTRRPREVMFRLRDWARREVSAMVVVIFLGRERERNGTVSSLHELQGLETIHSPLCLVGLGYARAQRLGQRLGPQWL